jgi:hypothetical protein
MPILGLKGFGWIRAIPEAFFLRGRKTDLNVTFGEKTLTRV